jgi:hypothetical protein
MAPTEIDAAGRRSMYPPLTPRTEPSRPARQSRARTFATVGAGNRVAAAISAAERTFPWP